MLLLVVLLPRRLVSGDIVLVRVRDNAKIPFFRLLGAELHLGDGTNDDDLFFFDRNATTPKNRHDFWSLACGWMGIRSAVKARLARPETLSVQPVKRRAMDEAGNRLRDAGVIFLWYSCSIVANSASKLVLTHGFRHPPTLAISPLEIARLPPLRFNGRIVVVSEPEAWLAATGGLEAR